MPLTVKEEKNILKSANALDLTPIRNYYNEKDGSDLVTIIIPKFKNKIIKKYVSSLLKEDHFKVKLDKFGSAVWLLINSETKVDQIIKSTKEKFAEELQEETERVTKFIFQLYNKGFITFKELN